MSGYMPTKVFLGTLQLKNVRDWSTWKCKLYDTDNKYSKLRLDSASWWENPQQPILRERLFVIKVILSCSWLSFAFTSPVWVKDPKEREKTGLSNAGLSHVWCLQPFQIKTQIFFQGKTTLPRSWGRVHLSSCRDWAAPWRAPSGQVLLPRLLPQVVVSQELGWGKDSAAA